MASPNNGEEASILNHDDILENIFSLVPLIHLVPAARVSKSWRRAVASSLRHLNPAKPWLLVHAQNTRSPYASTTRAYDPRSRVWVEIKTQPPDTHASALRSSSSTLLYSLSPPKFSFSLDPLHLTWHHVTAPLVWRDDPVVALVGQRVVVAGGCYNFEDDPLAVEIYDLETGAWRTSNSMPLDLGGSAAATWLSIAADETRMFVSDKKSGTTFSFDPVSETWSGPYEIRPDYNIFSSAIGFVNRRLVLVGLIGDDDDGEEEAKNVKIWEVNFVEGDLKMEYREIGEMPREMAEEVKCVTTVGMCSAGGLVYIYNPSAAAAEVAVWSAAEESGRCEWWMAGKASGCGVMKRVVMTSSSVTMGDLQRVSLLKSDESEQRRVELKETG